MIDTIKVLIPLTELQFVAILSRASDDSNGQWAKISLKSGEIWLVRIKGLASTDQHSYHREIRWDIPATYTPNKTYLAVELSLPKLFYGDNIRLLYDPLAALELLRKYLNQAFKFRTKRQLTEPKTWSVTRVDPCYCWKFPDQEHAQHFLNGLKGQRFPHKEPTIRKTSIAFSGGSHSTYSAKFYLKLPEFLAHDAKAMRKAKVPESEIRFREHLATGILRFEVTLRQKWLKRNGIETVADVIDPIKKMVFDEDLVNALTPFFNPQLVAFFITSVYLQNHKFDLTMPRTLEGEILLRDGDYFAMPAGQYAYGDYIYNHPGGGFRMEIIENLPEKILREMLEKMVGKEARLTLADRVRQKLVTTYKPTTAANLTAFWLFVQKFGADEALKTYGRDAYYYKRRQLKKAGVALLEQKGDAIIVGKDFFNAFALEIPSDHVGNRVDDYRDSCSVLNLKEHLDQSQTKEA